MLNYIYVGTYAAIVGIFFIIIYIICNTEDLPQLPSNNLIAYEDNYIYVPKHVLRALIIKYKRMLAKKAKVHIAVSPAVVSSFRSIEAKLLNFIRAHYNITITLEPYIIENYILNESINNNSPNNYICSKGGCDEEVANINDFSEYSFMAGKIIYLLEKILMLDHKYNRDISMPFDIKDIEALLHIENKIQTIDEIKANEHAHIEEQYSAVGPNYSLNDMINMNEYFIPTLQKPNKCSEIIRHNLQDYISDSAAQDLDNPFIIDYDDIQKCKNLKEAKSNWSKNRGLNFMLYTTEKSDTDSYIDYSANNNRISFENLKCNDLAYNTMKEQRNNSTEKQSLTNKWDLLEENFILN